jgi:hypothetical protein
MGKFRIRKKTEVRRLDGNGMGMGAKDKERSGK